MLPRNCDLACDALLGANHEKVSGNVLCKWDSRGKTKEFLAKKARMDCSRSNWSGKEREKKNKSS